MSNTKTLTLPNQLGSAILCMPNTAQPKAGVIVVHEWWGLNDYAKGRAEALADLGYAAIAVDMYGHGKTATDPEEAERGAFGGVRGQPRFKGACRQDRRQAGERKVQGNQGADEKTKLEKI